MFKRLKSKKKSAAVSAETPAMAKPGAEPKEVATDVGHIGNLQSSDVFDNVPASATLAPTRFRVQIGEQQLQEMKSLIQLSKIGPKTYESLLGDRKFGLSHSWFTDARDYWDTKFDWRQTELHINSYTQYEVPVKDDDGDSLAIHFTGIFSKHTDAIPIILLHGWPGSFLEFLQILDLLRTKYTPETLPYHVVVPSLPGFAFSTGPPLEKPWTTEDTARIMDKLMVGLGFGDGYVAQGGDLGSMIARVMAVKYDTCKAMHVNFNIMEQPESPDGEVTAEEQQGLMRAKAFSTLGTAYAREHGTRPATIGLALSTNPLALLAWIGEKFLEWSDTDPPLDAILSSVSLYWLTQTFPRSLYVYVQVHGDGPSKSRIISDPKYHCIKPFGYSWFPKELAPIPVSWVATTGNMIWSRSHTEGGHFAAMEKPELLLADIEDFIKELQ